jgi:TonB-dependent SusC/RagA subfamily outer membrane receptor
MDEIPDIPPTSVKSIEILKGTAASIYGSRGYGGVIIIKTKIQND